MEREEKIRLQPVPSCLRHKVKAGTNLPERVREMDPMPNKDEV